MVFVAYTQDHVACEAEMVHLVRLREAHLHKCGGVYFMHLHLDDL